MNSIGPNCNELKKVYDACFQNWFTNHFLKGETDDSMCREQFQQYNECVRRAMKDQKIDLQQVEHNILNTAEENKCSKSMSFKRNVMTFASSGQNKEQYGIIPQNSTSKLNFNKPGLVNIQTGNKHLILNVQHNTFYNISSVPLKGIPSISDPKVSTVVNVGLPFNGMNIEDFQLPALNNRELVDPINIVTEKKALNMFRIRKKKMKRHKWKKLQKKMKFSFAKKRLKRKMKKEAIFQKELNGLTEEGVKYSAEADLNERIAMLNWKPPVTRVRGLIAPQWVIDKHLKEERLKTLLDERIQTCLKKV